MATKILKESDIINLKFDSNSTNLTDEEDFRLYDLSYNGIEINRKNDDVPSAWDMVITNISNGMVTMEGDYGQQGGFKGYVTFTIPIDKISRYYDIKINPEDDDELKEELLDILRAHNLV